MNKQIHKLNLAYHLQHVTSYQNTVTTQWWHTQLKKTMLKWTSIPSYKQFTIPSTLTPIEINN